MITTTSTSAVSPNLAIVDGLPVTTSLNVAEVFGKRHDDVLKAINRVKIDAASIDAEGAARNFADCSYLDTQNRPRAMYQITRDGFTLLAMGFTGKPAMQFKLAYIAAFNAMEAELLAQASAGGRKSVDLNHYRRTLSPSGLDIRYTLDLTKIILSPTNRGLSLLESLTGMDLSDMKTARDVVKNNDDGSMGLDAMVRSFVAENLERAVYAPGKPEGRLSVSVVYTMFTGWYRRHIDSRMNHCPAMKTVNQEISNIGIDRIKAGGKTWFYGVAVKMSRELDGGLKTVRSEEVSA